MSFFCLPAWQSQTFAWPINIEFWVHTETETSSLTKALSMIEAKSGFSGNSILKHDLPQMFFIETLQGSVVSTPLFLILLDEHFFKKYA